MPQSLAKVLLHIVFSTKNRYLFLTDKNLREEMHAYLGGTCNNLDCPVLKVGGVADHVHVLCAFSRNLSIAKLVGELKRGSSKWIKTKGKMLTKFAWQNGYGAFSVPLLRIPPTSGILEGGMSSWNFEDPTKRSVVGGVV